jgi:ABC-2 type transport system ATP-binding protein
LKPVDSVNATNGTIRGEREVTTLRHDDEANAEGMLLVARGLEKRYKGASSPALKGIDISIRPGEIFGLLGPNGAGKTTAISIMSGLLRPDAGRVFVNGIDLLEHPDSAKRQFGLAPQEIALYPNLTVEENLLFFARLYGLKGELLKERVRECLSIASLEERSDLRVETCSGGMKRRANLAAGLLHSPRLLFLDEPTVGIDAQSRNLILERLKTLCRGGVGIVYTTHYMEEAEQLCDRVAIIDEGRILEIGEPKALMALHPECGNLGDLFLKLTGRQLRDE